jgi:sister-chromatid-cohesion protein PDS5
MGFYCLGGYEPEEKVRAQLQRDMVANVEKRREYIKTLLMTVSNERVVGEQLPHIMPDYMLVFSVPLLTHCPRFRWWKDEKELVG